MSRPLWELEAGVFRLLGHPTRLRLVEALRGGERTVRELQAATQSESSGVSQQLGLLRQAGVLTSRKQGTSVFYRVRDPRILELIDLTRRILAGRLEEQQALLHDLSSDSPPPTDGRPS